MSNSTIGTKAKIIGIGSVIRCAQCKAKTPSIQIIQTQGRRITLISHHSYLRTAIIPAITSVAVHGKGEAYLISSNRWCQCKLDAFITCFYVSIRLQIIERRPIYSKQFDTKSCVLRMICEARHYLLPPGKSLYHDIFRILLT